MKDECKPGQINKDGKCVNLPKAKKVKNKKTVLWAIALSIAMVAIIVMGVMYGGKEEVCNKDGVCDSASGETVANCEDCLGSSASSLLTYRMYDASGQQIMRTSGGGITTESIVDSVPGVSSIDFTITATNTGAKALSCDVSSLSPTAFDAAVVKGAKSVATGAQQSWTSSLISVAPFESTIPTVFTAGVLCSYSSGTGTITLPEKTGTLPILITAEDTGGASFELSLSRGGVGTEYCGDLICNSGETTTTCPGDCAVASYVQYRTIDINYVSGSAIAFTSSCGSALTAYGYSTKYGDRTGLCDTARVLLYNGLSENIPVTYVMDVPGGFISGGTNPARLFKHNTDATLVYICDDDGTKYTSYKYSSADSDASKVSISATSSDTSKEVAC